MKNIEFSVLSYSPSAILGERINLGILFYDVETDSCLFEHTKRWSRISSFDDEADIGFFKLYLEGIKQEVEPSLLKSKRSWREFIYNFSNEFRFSSVTKIEIDESFNDFVEETKRMYLRFDYDKHKRPTDSEKKSYINRLLRSKKIEFSGNPIDGIFGDSISFDFTLKNDFDSFGVKTFNFDGKDIKRMIYSVRAWAQIATELSNEIKSVFIYDIDDISNKDLETALKILKSSNAKVLPFSQTTEFIDEFVPSTITAS